MTSVHHRFMKKALALAKKAEGQVSPNPMVGALIVKKNTILGKGYHKKHGGPHAEVHAIESCKESVKGATLYTTLEPCCHTKKQTPPCVDLIIQSGIKEVIIGSLDPNPQVNGKGMSKLKRSGIKVSHGYLVDEENLLNEVFRKNMMEKKPFIHLKVAQTLDGKIATTANDSKWITDEDARQAVHRLRGKYQGLCVGRGTIDADNPFLNIRYDLDKKFSHPKILILGEPRTDKRKLNIYDCRSNEDVYYFTRNKLKAKKEQHVYFNSPSSLLKKIYQLGIHSVLVEGGSQTFSYFLQNKCFDRLTVFQASHILGEGLGGFDDISTKLMKNSIKLELTNVKKINNQLQLDFIP